MDTNSGRSNLPRPRLSAAFGHKVDPRAAIRAKALGLGFDAIGFAGSDLGSEVGERLSAFLQAGYHGEMGWLEPRHEQRSQPRLLWPDVRSIVAVGMSYAPLDDPTATLALHDRGTISAYAAHRDYHDVMKGRLKHLGQFMTSRFACQIKVFVDTAPVPEKPVAQRAGIGWQGKHSNLVSRTHGSWLFLGEIYTDLELQPEGQAKDRCGSCQRCLQSCPTDAFVGPYQLNATRCISYLTIEHKGPIPVDLRSRMGNRIYGCDDCLAVCPWNKFARATPHEAFVRRPDLNAPELAELAALDDAAFRARFAGSPIKRIGRSRFVRNVLTAIGNSGDCRLLPIAEQLCNDSDRVIADAASWACAQLNAAAHVRACSSSARA